jgi:hypothetical protein
MQKENQMSKRFTSTTKWDDEWFLTLTPLQKLFWFYICDKCDHAGVWKVSPTAASMQIGSKIILDDFLKVAGDRIKVLNSEYWHISKFCDFQYGKLDERNSAHKGALKILRSRGLEAPLTLPLGGLQPSKDMVKDMVKDKDEAFNRFWDICDRKKAVNDAKKAFFKLKPEHQEAAIKAWPLHSALWKKENREDSKKPYPATWLNRGDWMEEIGEYQLPPAELKGAALCAVKGHALIASYNDPNDASIKTGVECSRCPYKENLK